MGSFKLCSLILGRGRTMHSVWHMVSCLFQQLI